MKTLATNKQNLIQSTEQYLGKNTVVDAIVTWGYMSIELINEALAQKVYETFSKMEDVRVFLEGTKVTACE